MIPDKKIAQDARFNEKKGYFVDLVKALKSIKGEMGGENGEANRAKSLPSTLPHAHARVDVAVPVGPHQHAGWMTSKEIRGMIKEHCGLIKTVDKDMIPGIERRVKRIYEGTSTPTTLQRYLEKECDLEDYQAARIVRDQMQKYEARARLERMRKQGVKLVRWCHGGAHEPRPWHHNKAPYGLNGKVFPIDQPPVIDPATGERGYPGQLIGCHCYLEAVE